MFFKKKVKPYTKPGTVCEACSARVSPYSDSNPRFNLEGKYLCFFC